MVPRKKISIRSLLEWAYADELVHAAGREGVPREMTIGYSTRLATMGGGTGEAIDSSVKMDFEAPHDAYRVADAVGRLLPVTLPVMRDPSRLPARADIAGERPRETEDIVIHRATLVPMHALRREEPEWFPEPSFRMKPGSIVYHPRNRSPMFCRVEPDGDLPHEVDRARANYSAWVSALRDLRSDLFSRLKAHELTNDLPHLAPWRGNA